MKHFKIPKKLGEDWISRLRDGNYTQGQRHLYADEHYCCMGVLGLCMNYTIDQMNYVGTLYMINLNELILYDQKVDIYGMEYSAQTILWNLNDIGPSSDIKKFFNLSEDKFNTYTFEQIADFIEANFEFVEEVI